MCGASTYATVQGSCSGGSLNLNVARYASWQAQGPSELLPARVGMRTSMGTHHAPSMLRCTLKKTSIWWMVWRKGDAPGPGPHSLVRMAGVHSTVWVTWGPAHSAGALVWWQHHSRRALPLEPLRQITAGARASRAPLAHRTSSGTIVSSTPLSNTIAAASCVRSSRSRPNEPTQGERAGTHVAQPRGTCRPHTGQCPSQGATC